MNNYSDCINYLKDLGLPEETCEKICEKYEKEEDLEGLIDYMLLCEMLVDSCVD